MDTITVKYILILSVLVNWNSCEDLIKILLGGLVFLFFLLKNPVGLQYYEVNSFINSFNDLLDSDNSQNKVGQNKYLYNMSRFLQKQKLKCIIS